MHWCSQCFFYCRWCYTFKWFFFLNTKDQVKPIFLKMVQSDNGGGLKSLEYVLEFLGIIHHFTCPYTSEQNGVIESRHWRVVETSMTLLHSFLNAFVLLVLCFFPLKILLRKLALLIASSHCCFWFHILLWPFYLALYKAL